MQLGGGIVGRRIFEATTTASAQQNMGGGLVGRTTFEAVTTASAQNNLGGGAVGKILFETVTTASGQTQLGGGTVGRNVFESVTTASALTQIDASPRSKRVVTKTSAYAVTADDDIILTSGSFTLSMPPANSTGNKEFVIKRIDSTVTAALTVSAGSNIDGSSSITLNGTLRPFRRIQSTGSTFVIVGSSNEI